jgi:hypothetical protein
VAFVHANSTSSENDNREAQKEAIRAARENEKLKIQEMKNSNASTLQKRAEIHKVRAITQKNIRAMQEVPQIQKITQVTPQKKQSYFESFINIFKLWQ